MNTFVEHLMGALQQGYSVSLFEARGEIVVTLSVVFREELVQVRKTTHTEFLNRSTEKNRIFEDLLVSASEEIERQIETLKQGLRCLI